MLVLERDICLFGDGYMMFRCVLGVVVLLGIGSICRVRVIFVGLVFFRFGEVVVCCVVVVEF